jgi:hypothetical protein
MARTFNERVGHFDRVCQQVLEANGYKGAINKPRLVDVQVDFVGVNTETGEQVIAEFKLYLSPQIRPTLLTQTLLGMSHLRHKFPLAHFILVASVPLSSDLMDSAKEVGVDEIWDLPVLIQKAQVDPALLSQLMAALTDAGVGDLGTIGSQTLPNVTVTPPLRTADVSGAKLCESLHKTNAGQEGWRQFEDLCKEALLFLFGDQFGYWSEQSETSDDLHRRDFLVRLRPKHDFWIALAHDFRSRYIVFEFKDYAAKISQNQIYSTEKYLFTTALRSIAIIVARNGADDGALRAAGGALREAGKLVLIFSLDDLCTMLHGRDKGDEPEVLMYSKLDELLTTLGR